MATEQKIPANDKSKGIVNFVQETKREVEKVTWPTRKEISMTTMLIVVFAVLTGVFFLVVDWGLGFVVSKILGLSS